MIDYLVVVDAFSSVLFQPVAPLQHITPSKKEGVDIELPNFDELFGRIQQVSPLAKQTIEAEKSNDSSSFRFLKGFGDINDKECNLRWKQIESRPRQSLHSIQKIDHFQNVDAPLLRFRASLRGPCLGVAFANFIMDLETRKRWDAQLDYVAETYPIYDLDYANIAMGFGRKYGDCTRLGVGYCRTKANLGISPREQLTICGIQDFHSTGSFLIWGVEMAESWHDHLFPQEFERTTRAKSHLFSVALVPTSEHTFDVEYVLQLEVGGMLPTWLTTPIMLDSIKGMFHLVESFFQNKNNELAPFLLSATPTIETLENRQAILMTP